MQDDYRATAITLAFKAGRGGQAKVSLPTVSSFCGTFLEAPTGYPPHSLTGPSSHGHAYLQDRLEKVVFVNRVCYLMVPHHDVLRKEERVGPDQQ